MPGSSRVGVSRKIEDREERARLRKLAKAVLPKDQGGIIVRTVSEELNQETFQKDFKRLSSKWRKILKNGRPWRPDIMSGVTRELGQPDCVMDDVGREAVSFEGKLAHRSSLKPNSFCRQHSLCDNACWMISGGKRWRR